MVQALVFSLLFLLPFIILPFGITQFENPKVLIAEAGVILLLIAELRSKVNLNLLSKKKIFLYLSIFLLSLLHLIFIRSDISIFGNVFRLQGIFLLWILLLFSFLSRKIGLSNVPWWLPFIIMLMEVLLTLILPIDINRRFVGTLGEPNASASFLIFLWPFVFYGLKREMNRLISIILQFGVVALSFFGALFLFNSGSALIGLGLQLIFLILLYFKIPIKKILAICLILLAISLSLPFFEKTEGFESRSEIWRSSLHSGLNNPILGGGFGNIELLLKKSAVELNLPVQYSYVDSSHNIFLDWWVQGGIVGLSLILFLVFLATKSFVGAKDNLKIMVLLGLLTTLSFNPASVVGLLQFWWLIGQDA